MIVNCQKDSLLSACQIVSAAVAARTPKPILSSIKMIAEGNQLTLIGTDLEVGIRFSVAAVQIDTPGEAIVPVNRLSSILRETRDNEITLDADERRCLLTSASAEYEMPGDDPAAFPDVPAFESSTFQEVTTAVLRELIQRTIFAVAKQDTKYAINGVLWETEDKTIRLVATDTRRLAVASGLLNAKTSTNVKGQTHVIPIKAMQLLDKSLGNDNELVKIDLRSNDVLFQSERALIYSRLLEGRYPPYRDIIPKKTGTKILLPVDSFLASIRQSAIMVDEETNRVSFQFTPGKLTLQAQSAKSGRSKVEMPIDYHGENMTIFFDPMFMIDMLKMLPTGEVILMEMVNASKPALFRSGENYLYLVMPLN